MAISDRLNKLTTDITNAYTSIDNKGGTIPANKNTDNLHTAIDSIEVIEQATAEGESLSLANTKAMPYSDYIVKGKSEQEGTPSSSNPSEIHSVADDVNLFDKEATVVSTGYITSYTYSNGIYTIIPTGTGNPQIRLNVSIPQGTYTLNSNNYLSIATILRNNNGILYSFQSNYENQTFTINESSTELVFNWINPNNTNPIILDLNSLKIQKGSVATPYSPYNQGTVTIKQRGKNLIDNNNLQYDFSNVPNTYNQLETIETGIRYSTTYSSGTPMIIFNTGIDLTSHIGKTIKMKSTISSNAGSIRVGIANADTSLRQYKANTNISNEEISFLVTDDLGEKKYLIYYLAIDVGIGNTADFKNLTLTIDEEPIYEPYQANDFTLQTEPLRSLPNGVKDTIEEDGIHRRVGSQILGDVTELIEATVFGTPSKFASYELQNAKNGNRNYDFMSDKLFYANEQFIKYGAYRNQTALIVLTTIDDTLENFNSKISGSEVLYPLAEEIIEPLTQNQATTMLDIIKTGSYEGTTNIYTDEDVKPTIGVGYYKKA